MLTMLVLAFTRRTAVAGLPAAAMAADGAVQRLTGSFTLFADSDRFTDSDMEH
jgi:hypothetical protein